MYQLSLLTIALCVLSAYSQLPTLNPNNTLICRLCVRANTLSDCNKFASCDATLEDCYMDELITDQLTTVYVGGCRAKDVCNKSGKRKRDDLVACSRCCDFEDDCNKRLCGIKDDTIHSSQCYSCDHRNSEQSEVRDPKKCVTLQPCQSNQMCYAQQSDVSGVDTFFYGCLSKLKCRYVMKQAYTDFQTCVTNATAPIPPYTWTDVCGNLRKRTTNLCHSCCDDPACNYGSCQALNDRIFKLVAVNKFNIDTLKKI